MFSVVARGGNEAKEGAEEEFVPKMMNAIQMSGYAAEGFDHLNLIQLRTPVAKQGEVLIRVEATPVTSDDVNFIRGGSAAPFKGFPVIPGFEAVGVAVQSGGGLGGWSVLGKRVAVCIPQQVQNGCWAEYVSVPSEYVQSVDSVDLPIDVLCRLFSMPLTAVNMIDSLKSGGHKAGIHTDAAGPLGRMLLRLGIWENIPIVHIVANTAEAEVLKNLGGEYVLCSADDNFDGNLRSLAKALGATLAFDAMGGKMTGRVLSSMPQGGCIRTYGSYDRENVSGINVNELILHGKQLAGLTPIEKWVVDSNLFSIGSAMRTAQRLFESEIRDKEVVMRAELKDFIPVIEKFEEISAERRPGGPRQFVALTPNPPREVLQLRREQKAKEEEAKAKLREAERRMQEKKTEKEKEEKQKEKKEKKEVKIVESTSAEEEDEGMKVAVVEDVGGSAAAPAESGDSVWAEADSLAAKMGLVSTEPDTTPHA